MTMMVMTWHPQPPRAADVERMRAQSAQVTAALAACTATLQLHDTEPLLWRSGVPSTEAARAVAALSMVRWRCVLTSSRASSVLGRRFRSCDESTGS